MPKVGNNLPKVKKQNEVLIKETIFYNAPITRVEIAEKLNLTLPTITTNVSRMIDENLLCEIDCDTSLGEKALGRKAKYLDINPQSNYCIGIEILLNGVYVCLTDIFGRVLYSKKYDTVFTIYEDAVKEIKSYIDNIIVKSEINKNLILGVGVTVPGYIDSQTGFVKKAVASVWTNRFLSRDLQKEINVPVFVENNVRARAIAYKIFKRDSSLVDYAYFMVSRGIACPLILGSKVYKGNHYSTGEIGHTIVDRNGPVCSECGRKGCLEAIASESAICKQCEDAIKNNEDTVLKTISKDINNINIEEVLEAQKKNDKVVNGIVRKSIDILAISLSNIINYISVPYIIIDSMLLSTEKNQKMFTDVFYENLLCINDEKTKTVFLPSDVNRGALGGCALALQKTIFKY